FHQSAIPASSTSLSLSLCCFSFLSSDPAPTHIYTLSLHDALPIYSLRGISTKRPGHFAGLGGTDKNLNGLRNDTIDTENLRKPLDRKSTRLNSSHGSISYAVFCLKKKKKKRQAKQ